MAVIARSLVSKKKVRFQEDGFDLDLTYITPRVIAMGFPSRGVEGIYRNPMDEVKRFFAERHAGKFRIYNLCSERAYELTAFDGATRWYPFDDHSAPAPISLIPALVRDAQEFLAADPKHVVAVHCKAGKGRTGLMISCLLMQLHPEYRLPHTALAHFGETRTHNGKGVTIPSQHRYVRYYSDMLNKVHGGGGGDDGWDEALAATPRAIASIHVAQGCRRWGGSLYVVVVQGAHTPGAAARMVYDSRDGPAAAATDNTAGTTDYFFDIAAKNVDVAGDVKILFKTGGSGGSSVLFQCWVNTTLEEGGTVVLPKDQLDKAVKDCDHRAFSEGLAVSIQFTPVRGGWPGARGPADVAVGRAMSPIMETDDDEGDGDGDGGAGNAGKYRMAASPTPASTTAFPITISPPKDIIQKLANNPKVEAMALVVFGWFVLWLLLEDDALIDGPIFPVAVLYLAAVVCGTIISWVKVFNARIPDLLGMLLVGCLLRNVGAVDGLRSSWSGAIRKMALAVILIRAGLVLSVDAVRKNGRATVLLSFLPCTVECCVVAVAARFILSPTLDWSWCFILGFCIAAVSPAVIVPSLTDLKLEGYGVKKGIPSMVLAAAGIDDVIAVAGFGMAFGLTFSSSSLAMSILHAPIDVAIGVVGSVVIGFLTSFLVGVASHEFLAALLILIGIACVVGSGRVDHTGGGALATMFIGVTLRHYANRELPEINAWCGSVWNFLAKPLLFVMIGTAVDLSTVTGSLIGKGIGILALGLVFRLPSVLLCTSNTALTRKERLFIMMSWFPKATVQAALGPLALDEVKSKTPVDATHQDWAEQILTLSVLAIITTAPIGAVLIEVFGRTWLTKLGDEEEGEGAGTVVTPPPAAAEPSPPLTAVRVPRDHRARQGAERKTASRNAAPLAAAAAAAASPTPRDPPADRAVTFGAARAVEVEMQEVSLRASPQRRQQPRQVSIVTNGSTDVCHTPEEPDNFV